jgi:hypothetical protein
VISIHFSVLAILFDSRFGVVDVAMILTGCGLWICSELVVKEEVKKEVVTTEDLAQFMKMLDGTDGGPTWNIMMDKFVPDMTYQAWRRDPEQGPTQYKSRTVFENLSPEFIRDFFWDDQFRAHWDDMLSYSKIWEEDKETGALIVQWVRKVWVFDMLPFFELCSAFLSFRSSA